MVLDYFGTHETGNASEMAASYICNVLDKYPVMRARRWLWDDEAEEDGFPATPIGFHNAIERCLTHITKYY